MFYDFFVMGQELAHSSPIHYLQIKKKETEGLKEKREKRLTSTKASSEGRFLQLKKKKKMSFKALMFRKMENKPNNINKSNSI